MEQTDTTTTTTPASTTTASTAPVLRSRTDVLYRLLASKIQARLNCLASGNTEWKARHEDAIRQIARDVLPSGSGIDSGTSIDLDRSTGEKIVLLASFHHMNDGGMYDGWTEHTITVRASLIHGVDVTIGGRNRNGIKEYLGDVFAAVLQDECTETYDPAADRSSYRMEAQTVRVD